ncbi:hypothetical protein [Pseudomonas fluorescens]|uniref:hypothetical protein n=1 Tax=Pseudomonas fluorescens TaxID=294 RepID=UPI00177F3D4A|nr:hypothetical protein [Pseudomonas fluorescens]
MTTNKRKEAFLKKIPTTDIENSGILKYSKINFKFFDVDQEPSSSFDDLSEIEAKSLLKKLHSFSGKSLNEWAQENAGGNGLKVYARYNDFPKNSDFTHPPHVPHDALWGRFRLGNKYRLVGFVIPDLLHGEGKSGFHYDKNTFYVVFIDKEHRFYKTEDA